MLHVNMPREFEVGDEVALTGIVITILPSGRARVSIPSYDHPYTIDPPPKVRAGDRVVLVGDVTRIDRAGNKLTVRIDCGGVITVDKSAITRLRKHRRTSAGCRSGDTMAGVRLGEMQAPLNSLRVRRCPAGIWADEGINGLDC
ncbi:hypothetical protein NKH23_18455 [Mesorhizobium sp. M1328]|uniref:hypothetical protein n=1 Tax=Mesorhizobium sp. M1328 TaxID=2957082 RepID=UPI00333716AA